MKLRLALLLLLFPSCAHALDLFSVATVPSCGAQDAYSYAVFDAASGASCAVGGGSTYLECACLGGSVYVVAPISPATIDHGSLGGLSDDDHAQYALLAGRASGQTLVGGTVSTDPLVLTANSDASSPQIAVNAAGTGNVILLRPDRSTSANDVGVKPGSMYFEGSTADANETYFTPTDPTADRIVTIPNADSVTVQGATCSGSDKVSAISTTTGAITCSADSSGGDSITVNSSAATDPDFLNGDIDWTLSGGNSITATVGCADCVALSTETSGSYAAGDAEAGNALTGDTATAFFSAGQIEAARGGTGADSSAFTGLAHVASGTWSASTAAAADIADDAITEPKIKAVDSPTDEDILTYEATTGDFEWHTQSEELDKIGSTQGQILYRGASAWSVLGVGTSGQVLRTNGTAANPSWATANAVASFDNPPSTPHSYSCEFSNSLCNFTWGAGPASGTVNPTGTLSATQTYDMTTWPGWLLFQGHNVATTEYDLTETITLDTDATITFHGFSQIRGATSGDAQQAADESTVGFFLSNSGDANELVVVQIRQTGSGATLRFLVQNNGANTTITGGGASGGYVALIKESNAYVVYTYDQNGSMSELGSITKTGVTTLDRLVVMFNTSNDTRTPINGIDFIRYVGSKTFALINQ